MKAAESRRRLAETPVHRKGRRRRRMTDPFGFLKVPRRPAPARPVDERLSDWDEVYAGQPRLPLVSEQAGRCMDCGIPFCHSGCPLGNLIPEWNTYARRENWQ